MPNRLVRDGLLTSWRYERLSSDGKLFFFHLLLCADDLGCIELGPTYLRRRVLFSMDSDERIAKLINELVDVDLLRPYQDGGRCLGFIPRFRQRVQIKYARFPMPPDGLLHDDDDAKQKFQRIKELKENTTVVQQLANRWSTVGQHTVSGKREAVIKEKDIMSGKPDVSSLQLLKAQAREIIDFLNSKTGRNYQHVESNLKFIVARLKEGATPDDCRAVIASRCRKWRGDPKMEEYLRPATLFNAEKFASYRGEIADAQAVS